MKRVIITTGLLAASFSVASAATLDTVKQRGTLVCGVSAGFAGFSTPDSQGNYKGLDVDYCRALAAGVLGDPSRCATSRSPRRKPLYHPHCNRAKSTCSIAIPRRPICAA